MTTVAFIGGDGAGKTTIAHAVIQSSKMPMKYLYMGMSTRSSNRALLTSRLVLYFKRRKHKHETQKSQNHLPGDVPSSQLEYGESTHGWVWNFARFLNRLAEAWYRQLLSIFFQLRGYIVVYDRHFFFDSAPDINDLKQKNRLLFDRLYFWLICHVYPRPTLTIFLDASPALLYQRKGEATPEYLEEQRKVYLEQGKKLAHFFRVDASQPLDWVLDEVIRLIQDHCNQSVHQRPGLLPKEEINRHEP